MLTEFVATYGLWAIFITMLLESAMIPIPSEIVVPLGGFFAAKGAFSLWTVVWVSSVANLIGSLLAYYLGKFARPYFPHFMEDHLELAEIFFKKHGNWAILTGRMLPAVRTFMSMPAGLAHTPIIPFTILTFLGSVPWNFLMAWLGFTLAENWTLVHHYGTYVLIGLIAICLPIGIYVLKNARKIIEWL